LPVGCEASAVIEELPTDPAVLENEEYKKRGFKKGSKVAIVSSAPLVCLSTTAPPYITRPMPARH